MRNLLSVLMVAIVMLMLVGCGSGGGGDDTEIVAVKPTPTPAPVDPGDCVVFVAGDLVICLAGDCNNTVPIEDPIIEEVEEPAVADEGDQTSLQGSLIKMLVHGKIQGVNITLDMCSTSSTSESTSSTQVVPQ